MKPIYQVEADLRRVGIFILVDPWSLQLKFYGFKRNQAALNQAADSLWGRAREMANFLIARANSAEGETK